MGLHQDCPTCECSNGTDTRLFLKYDEASDNRDSTQKGRCSDCKEALQGYRAVTVQYSSGARRYYNESCARRVVGWNGEYDSTTAQVILEARAQLSAGQITVEDFVAIVDLNS